MLANEIIDGQCLADWVTATAGTIDKSPGHLAVGNETWVTTMLVRTWPYNIKRATGLLQALSHIKFKKPKGISVRTTLRIIPANFKLGTMGKMKIRRLEKSVKTAEFPRPDEVKALRAFKYLAEQSSYARVSVLDLWCFITVSATSEELLESAVNEVEKTLTDIKMSATKLPHEQTQAFLETWSAGTYKPDFYKAWPGRLIDEEALSVLNPFLDGSLTEERGLYMGNRVSDQSFVHIVLKRGDLNKNFIVLGESGGGKSTFLKALVVTLLLEGYKVYVLDVDGEYEKLCKKIGGVWVDHNPGSGKYFDPLKIPRPFGKPEEDAGRLMEVSSKLQRTISLLAGGISPEERNVIDRALVATWKDSEIDPDDQSTWDDKKCNMHQWYQFLCQEDSNAARELRNRLYMYFEGSQKKMFTNSESTEDLEDARAVFFHVARGINKSKFDPDAAVKMSLTLDTVWELVIRNKIRGEQYSAVFTDEGQRVLPNNDAWDFINTLASTIRKYNGLLALGANNPSVLWPSGSSGNNDDENSIWGNSAYKVLFGMEDSHISQIQKKAKIPDEVLNKLNDLRGNHGFIIRVGKNFDALRLELSSEELELYKTEGLNQ
ncbi:VirB4 family type IV secretion system protein [Desulforamulus aquiferis]|uniref:DUF87 domain-containing protein n=1 Tax=Desulforamulus aquiferis TaxID=1397668 RepID=A0AAW7Z987_9FIRM|nr:DUF87 domain-containing protein [Desulforamulus aquiferis]MDO7785814.1 DUF87 domain-containing protein [Desulforamulus aquiferis]